MQNSILKDVVMRAVLLVSCFGLLYAHKKGKMMSVAHIKKARN